MNELTHIDKDGRARMVDITDKIDSNREAVAAGIIAMSEKAYAAAVSRQAKKGDPITIAEVAGIMAAKNTSTIIPLCHPIALSGVNINIKPVGECKLRVEASAKTNGQTGVEMEALMAVSAACLTLYDMLKAIDKSMVISEIKLLKKSGGKSGIYEILDP